METETKQDYGLPKDKLFFSLLETKETGLMSIERAKQELYKGKLKGVKNGVKWLIPRAELIRYIDEEMSADGTTTEEEPPKRAGHVYKPRKTKKTDSDTTEAPKAKEETAPKKTVTPRSRRRTARIKAKSGDTSAGGE